MDNGNQDQLLKEPQRWTMILLLVGVTIAFLWVIWPFSGAILWAIIAAIVATPSYLKRVDANPKARGRWAGLYTFAVLAIIIIPALGITSILVEQALGLVNSIQTGEINLAAIGRDIQAAMPAWVRDLAASNGFGTIEDAARQFGKLLAGSAQILVSNAVTVGTNALSLFLQISIMLYLFFFFLRDGRRILATCNRSIPLAPRHKAEFGQKFMSMARATIKGTLIVALVQGILGGITFWMLGINAPVLWGALMGVFSLIPAFGTGVVWLPMAIYLMLTGDVTKGVILLAIGAGVISMVDNVLRPILVGKDTGLPDWLLLIVTLGGVAVFGFNGILIGPMIAALFIAAWDMTTRDHVLVDVSKP